MSPTGIGQCGRGGAPRRSGFTLIEVLATLALVAIVVPAVVNGISLCLAAAGHARCQSQATVLAQTKLAELIADQQWQSAEQSGDFGTDWPDYRWSAQVTEWDTFGLQQVDVTVSWKHQGRDRWITLTTLVYTGFTSE